MESPRVSSIVVARRSGNKIKLVHMVAGYVPVSTDTDEARSKWYDDINSALARVKTKGVIRMLPS